MKYSRFLDNKILDLFRDHLYRLHKYKKSERGVCYVIPYGKSKLVQFLHTINIFDFFWMWLSFRGWIAINLFNNGWISLEVFKKLGGKRFSKRKMFCFE